MSRRQLPRWPEFYPRMKHRARKRHLKRLRIIWYDNNLYAFWPKPWWTVVNWPTPTPEQENR